jgi:TRAP-type C4-dicarboxylate transport system permease small subunit
MAPRSQTRAARADALRAALHAIERTTAVFAFVGIGLLVIAVGLALADIVWRRLLGGAVVGVIDLTQLCVMAAAFWSIPYAFSTRAHVVVDLLSANLGRRARLWLDALGGVLSLALMALVLYLGWQRALEQWQFGDVSQDLGIPLILYWAFLLSGAALGGIAAAAAFVRDAIDPGAAAGAKGF